MVLGLSEGFNPTRFNPDAWAKMAKDAGMRYVVFTQSTMMVSICLTQNSQISKFPMDLLKLALKQM